MATLLHCLLIVLGAVLVIWGADRFTDGASALARRMRIPQVVVGLTIVAFGTSAPELATSVTSALQDMAGMAVGNVVGSNIFNTLLIIGAAAVIMPVPMTHAVIYRDFLWAVGATALFIVLGLDHAITRLEALALLVGFAAFLFVQLRQARRDKSAEAPAEASPRPEAKLWKCWTFILLGIACLALGSHLFVEGAVYVAQALQVDETLVGLTVVAGGTSLPELATTVVSARKGQAGLAIGNVVGSNVLNILLILGLTGAITPLRTEGITVVDLAVCMGSTLLLWLFCRTKFLVERYEGCLLLLIWAAYMAWLVSQI